MQGQRYLLLLLLALGAALSPAAWPHPGHASEAELDWDASGEVLEVSLAVFPEHLEEAIGLRLEAPTADQALQRYLQQHFRLTGPAGSPGKVKLLGLEAEYRRTWLYFTVRAPASPGLYLEFTLLQELLPGQLNRARALWSTADGPLVFGPESGPLPLPARPGEPLAESAL